MDTEMMPHCRDLRPFLAVLAESFVLIAGVMAAETELISPLRTQTAFKEQLFQFLLFIFLFSVFIFKLYN